MWRLSLVLLLAACSAQGGGACSLRIAADLAVLPRRDRLEVSAKVNGTEEPMLVDTGADRTILASGTVSALLLARSQRSSSRLSGITGPGGAVSGADAYATIDLGGVRSEGEVAVADLPGVAGLVGGDLLSGYDVEFDLPDGRVRLWDAKGCGAADLPWTGARTTIPIDVSGHDRLILPVAVDGQTIDAVLDSGASSTLLSADAARRLGVTEAQLQADPSRLGSGVGRGALAVRAHRFASLRVGDERFDNPRIAVAELQLRGAEMLLGRDFLRGSRVWVSYRTERLFVQQAAGGPSQR